MSKSDRAPRFTESRQCGHCGVHSTMTVVAEFSDVSPDNSEEYAVNAGACYELLQCPACKGVELQSYNYCDAFEMPYFDYKTVYPPPQTIPLGLPKKIQREYLEALKLQRGSPNAYGVLMGRVLEHVCQDKKAKGKMLGQQIEDLAKRNLIPSQLATIAFRLNDLRIFGAHSSVGKLGARHIPILENLTRAVLEYVYSSPLIVKRAEMALKQLNRRKRR